MARLALKDGNAFTIPRKGTQEQIIKIFELPPALENAWELKEEHFYHC